MEEGSLKVNHKTNGKGKLQKSLEEIVEIVEQGLAKFPITERNARRKEIHRIAISSGRRTRGKASKPLQTRATRLSSLRGAR